MTKKLMILAAVVAAAFGAWAEKETVGDYMWTYWINGDTAEIRYGYSAAISPSPTGAVTISSTLGGKPVTSIGYSAFSGCSGLMSISVGPGNANYKSVNGLLLSKDGKTLIQGVNGDEKNPLFARLFENLFDLLGK